MAEAIGLSTSRERLRHPQLHRSPLIEPFLIAGVALLAINEAAEMALPIMDRAVTTSSKVTVHHAARFADWKDTMQIDAGSAMNSMNPRRNLQKLSPLHAHCLKMKHLTGSWTQGLQPT
nr:hypothetical protein CFP56_42964 [Quercus suber]